MAARSFTIVALVSTGLGAIGGYALGQQRDTAQATPAAVTQPIPEERRASLRRMNQGLVCAATRTEPDEPDDPDQGLAAAQLRARWCEGRLAECRRERKAVRQPWPTDGSTESPEAWTEAVETAIEECQIPGIDLELMECSEYPCAAAFRPSANLGEDDLLAEQERVRTAFRACAPLRDAMGIDETTLEDAIEVYQHDARCGEDQREDMLVLSVLSPQGPAYNLMKSEDPSIYDVRDLERWIYRRADDIAGLWSCLPDGD